MSVFNIFAYEDEPFAGDVITEYEFIKLKHKFNVKNVVETGSYVFSTTKWFGENFQTVYTYETNEHFYSVGIEKTKDFNNVNSFLENSLIGLPNLQGKLSDPTIFFLDAHWGDYCPLLDELDIISTLNTTPIIVIHDFKTNNPELGYDSYNGNDFCFDWIENHIKKIYPNGFDYYYNTEAVGAKRGLIYITPKI